MKRKFIDCRADPAKLVTQEMINKFFAKRPRAKTGTVTPERTAACQHSSRADTGDAQA